VAFDVGELLVGGHDAGRVEPVGADAGADDIHAVQGGFGGDLGLFAGDAQGGVGDVRVEVFGHLVFVDQLADLEPDLVRAV
jgi:hypothetical protein